MKNQANKAGATPCPCGSGSEFNACCGRYLTQNDGQSEKAPTPEALMRSRYSAFVLRDDAYLSATWHPSSRPERVNLREEGTIKWLGLEILAHSQTGDSGSVEFIARHKVNGRAGRLHEVSRFVREDGAEGVAWYYLDGKFNE